MANKLEIFVRHCHDSSNSTYKERYDGFTHEACHLNLIDTIEDNDEVGITYILDGPLEGHFLKGLVDKKDVVSFEAGRDAASFLYMLNYVESLDLDSDVHLYFLEDDYMHLSGWIDILFEGLSIAGVDYVSLYDHKDKYFLPEYQALRAQIMCTNSCHWRTTPSTTNTYAMRCGTLKRDMAIHREFCDLRGGITLDHAKFTRLWEKGSNVITPIPGWSTHMEPKYASPTRDWEQLLNEYIKNDNTREAIHERDLNSGETDRQPVRFGENTF